MTMASKSQNMNGEETGREEGGVPVDAQPVGYLRILKQDEFEQTDYPVYEGESSIGRDIDCDLSIDARSLSRKHSVLLVVKGTHFVMDNGSRNKTYRKSVRKTTEFSLYVYAKSPCLSVL